MLGLDTNRLILIGCAAALIASTVYVAGESLIAGTGEVALTAAVSTEKPSIPIESGVFRREKKALAYKKLEDKPSTRSLADYYARRAFPGAPPSIPHQIFDERRDGKSCLACHADGEYVPFLKAYAPVVPHPEMLNCRQCHVAGKQDQPAVTANTFQPEKPPAIHGAAMPGAPPPIPHTLAMRNNCLACHAGPSAPKEIRTTHPERVNCRQCHVAVKEMDQPKEDFPQ